MAERVTIEVYDGVADVRLDRGDKMNAMDGPMFAALVEAADQSGFSLEVRIGVHEGEATPRDGDWIGMAVTMAARVAAAGGAGEVVCTDAVLSSTPIAVVAETRTIEAKGVPEPVSMHLISRC